jgi:hypothetical protein
MKQKAVPWRSQYLRASCAYAPLQEKMISGVTGEEMACDIYIGVVYYQRLRHMVSDKFQVCVCVVVVFARGVHWLEREWLDAV